MRTYDTFSDWYKKKLSSINLIVLLKIGEEVTIIILNRVRLCLRIILIFDRVYERRYLPSEFFMSGIYLLYSGMYQCDGYIPRISGSQRIWGVMLLLKGDAHAQDDSPTIVLAQNASDAGDNSDRYPDDASQF